MTLCKNQELIWALGESVSKDRPEIEVDIRGWSSLNAARSALTNTMRQSRDTLHGLRQRGGKLYFYHKFYGAL